MKHAEILKSPENDGARKHIEAGLADGRKVCLTEREYTREELRTFESGKAKWILRRSGTRQFTADSDSGEDAGTHQYKEWTLQERDPDRKYESCLKF